MDASKITSRQDSLISSALAQRANSLESAESVIGTQSDSDQDNSSTVLSSSETVTFSDTSLKLSASSPVKSTDRSAPIENSEQAQQLASQLYAEFQSNPSQAQGAHSNVFAGAVKSLLGPAL
jgi:hypothetical protein